MSYSNTSNDNNKNGRRKTAFAIGAVIALVGIAFTAAMFMGDEEGELAQTSSYGSGSAMDPVASLTDLSAPLPSLQGDADAAVAAMTGAAAEADASVSGVAGDAQARLDGAQADAHSILAGSSGDVDSALAVAGGSYAIADLRAQIEGAAGTSFVWESMPSTVSLTGDEFTFEATGEEDVDSALAQVVDLLNQAQAAWGSAEVQTVFATIDESGAPVATPGLLRAPFGADDAVEPDEDGALAAAAHADAFLGTLGTGYTDLSTGLSAFEDATGTLGSDVDTAIRAADQFSTEANAALDAEYEARIAMIEAAAADYEAAVHAAADDYRSQLEATVDDANAQLDAEIEAQREAVLAAAADARSDVEARAASVRAQADARIESITALEAEVSAMAEAGTIAAADAQAFLAASTDAKAQLDAQASAAEAQALSMVADIETQADAQVAELEGTAAEARAELDAQLADAIAWADAQEAMLTGEVDGAVATAIALQTAAHAEAQAAVDGYVYTYKNSVMSSAYDVIADARAEATKVQAILPSVQGEAYTEISNDIEYLQAVIEDYASIPTPERQAAADAWASVQSEIDGELGSVLVAGQDLQAQVDAVLSAAAEAEAGLSAYA